MYRSLRRAWRSSSLFVPLRRSAVFSAVCLFLIFPALPCQGVTIGFDPFSSTLSTGASFDLEVAISDLGEEIVSSFDLEVSYDPAILAPTGVAFGDALNGGDPFLSFQSEDLTTPGLVNIDELSLLSDSELKGLQPGGLTVATISFEALAAGTGSIDLVPDPVFGIDVKGRDAEILPIVVEEGRVAVVSPAPEPGTLLLLGAGLFSVASVSCFRKKKGSNASVRRHRQAGG